MALTSPTGAADAAWLEQIHGAEVVSADDVLANARAGGAPVRADASVTDRPGTVCAVMIADCMPVLAVRMLPAARWVPPMRAGAGSPRASSRRRRSAWRRWPAWTLPRCMRTSARASAPAAFEVGTDVRDAFIDARRAARSATSPLVHSRADRNAREVSCGLPALARMRLAQIGVTQGERSANDARSLNVSVSTHIDAIT